MFGCPAFPAPIKLYFELSEILGADFSIHVNRWDGKFAGVEQSAEAFGRVLPKQILYRLVWFIKINCHDLLFLERGDF
jgi:hypothetical protein